MTEENFKKAADIISERNTMERMYDTINRFDCIRFINQNGVSEVSRDPALIAAVKSAILNRQNELAEELERL